ncbi:hypothetical protein B0H14DRAFT_2897741 [Mycena olivaceomarginata]|nr:hypothetical protein B0H14DRAFT_2897741 [Mycena olivaceomarginata]
MSMSGPHSEDLLPTSSVRRVRLDGLTCPPNFGLITGTFPAKHYTRFFVTNQIEIDRLPSFLATPLNERHHLFLKKIQQCRVLFDFSDIASGKPENGNCCQLLTIVDNCPIINNYRRLFNYLCP